MDEDVSTLVVTLGFDEKFAVRAVIRYADKIDRVIVVTSTPVEQRVLNALNTLNRFIDSYVVSAGKKIEKHVIEVDVRSPYDAISVLRRGLFEKFKGPYILNLSGGMRALVIVALASFVISGARGFIEVELENLLDLVIVDPTIFYVGRLDSTKQGIVETIARSGKADYRDIMRELRIPRATLFRELKYLRNLGLISVERNGRTSYYYLTDLGRAYQ